jgi:hypothetical protein
MDNPLVLGIFLKRKKLVSFGSKSKFLDCEFSRWMIIGFMRHVISIFKVKPILDPYL